MLNFKRFLRRQSAPSDASARSREVGTGSSQEHAQLQEARRLSRSSRIGKRSAGQVLDLAAAAATANAANDMERLYFAHRGRRVDKWLHYLEVYDRHFAPYRGRAVTVVEIGVARGGSLELWRAYFGDKARIIGVDVKPKAIKAAPPDAEVYLGDQGDERFLRGLAGKIGPIDIVLDDGSHIGAHQIKSFEVLFPALAEGGLYVCEDLHTAYWDDHGGRTPGPDNGPAPGRETFIDRIRHLMDRMHAWHSRDPARFAVDDWTRSIGAIHVYDSMAIIDKRRREPPRPFAVGG